MGSREGEKERRERVMEGKRDRGQGINEMERVGKGSGPGMNERDYRRTAGGRDRGGEVR